MSSSDFITHQRFRQLCSGLILGRDYCLWRRRVAETNGLLESPRAFMLDDTEYNTWLPRDSPRFVRAVLLEQQWLSEQGQLEESVATDTHKILIKAVQCWGVYVNKGSGDQIESIEAHVVTVATQCIGQGTKVDFDYKEGEVHVENDFYRFDRIFSADTDYVPSTTPVPVKAKPKPKRQVNNPEAIKWIRPLLTTFPGSKITHHKEY